jgi:peptidylprolyl isomerase
VGRLADGTVFDATAERGPHELVIGDETTLHGFEEAIVGLAPGERTRVEIPARQAYGRRQRTLFRVLHRDLLPPGRRLRVGDRLRIEQENGTSTIVTVTGRKGDEVMVDLNHPLAGHDLVFEIELVEIITK